MTNDNARLEWLVECLIHVIGRAALKVEEVRSIVGSGKKQVCAFNLCDGSRTLTSVAKGAGLDRGNLSRTVDRWVKNGVMFKFEDGNEVFLLHVFPLPTVLPSTRARKKKGRR